MRNYLFLSLLVTIFVSCVDENPVLPKTENEELIDQFEKIVATSPSMFEVYGDNSLSQLQITPCADPFSLVYQGDTIMSLKDSGCDGCFFVYTALIRNERYIYAYFFKGKIGQGKLFIGKDSVFSGVILHFNHYQGNEYIFVYPEKEEKVWCLYNDSTYTLTEKGRR